MLEMCPRLAGFPLHFNMPRIIFALSFHLQVASS
jgi:hypothetical protein